MPGAPPKLPNFFLIGAPKAGTTALYHYLDQHPEIYMSPIKEPNFFADEFRLENFDDHFRRMAASRVSAQREYLLGPVREKFSGGPVSEWADYLKLYECVDRERAVGEASVSYLWSETAARNLATRFPNARLLMILRNPVERAFSQYAHMLSFAEEPIAFRAYLDRAVQSRSTSIGELYPFLNFGLYYGQVKRYLSLFDGSQIQIHFFEEFQRDPRSVLRRTFEFLSVDSEFEVDLSRRHMEAAVPRSHVLMNALKRLGIREALRGKLPLGLRRRLRAAAFQPRDGLLMSAEDRAWLIDYYREDIENLSRLLNRDLSGWFARRL